MLLVIDCYNHVLLAGLKFCRSKLYIIIIKVALCVTNNYSILLLLSIY